MVSLVQRLEESVRFELTEHYCSSVFKTDAINQTLPTFHVALGARLELATLWLTARCSTIELPKNTTPIHMVSIELTVYSLQELFYL